MILRGAQLEGSAYEWHQHRRWARQQGVPPEQIEDLFFWRESPRFTRCRMRGAGADRSDDARQRLRRRLRRIWRSISAPSEIIELALTAGFYAMVPRVLNALKVPIEEETLHAPVGGEERAHRGQGMTRGGQQERTASSTSATARCIRRRTRRRTRPACCARRRRR